MGDGDVVEHLKKGEDGEAGDEPGDEGKNIGGAGVGEDGGDVEDEDHGGDELAGVCPSILPVVVVSLASRLDHGDDDFFLVVFIDQNFRVVLKSTVI